MPIIHQITNIANSRLFTIESIDLEFNNKKKRTYERLKPKNLETVIVVPIIHNQLLLIQEYGIGTENYRLNFPKGTIKSEENIINAANRELMEETKFGAKKIVLLHKLFISPSYTPGTINIVLAKKLYKKELKGDEPESLPIIYWPVNHMLKLLNEPNFCDTRNVCALLLTHIWMHNIIKTTIS
ncbi:ADP compounds hydrolase NudE [Candidatus Westeberhardia cardiocondylae]|uniref:ADP compounds hydrolase NudE n=1 Tax=Candidatus Westeberhardia cardiocondylae TaxID=1594731 RepID=A0A0H5BWK3_9ENTR|nr:ADP compounds hydrolase NudE [Candidatus Westeberhardia cardiocondylae]CEN32023.1 ADP compounds hydrolase NudE [Candidatus Westeberhardia cardiocondylae]